MTWRRPHGFFRCDQEVGPCGLVPSGLHGRLACTSRWFDRGVGRAVAGPAEIGVASAAGKETSPCRRGDPQARTGLHRPGAGRAGPPAHSAPTRRARRTVRGRPLHRHRDHRRDPPVACDRGFAVLDQPGLRLRTLADVFAYADAEGVTFFCGSSRTELSARQASTSIADNVVGLAAPSPTARAGKPGVCRGAV